MLFLSTCTWKHTHLACVFPLPKLHHNRDQLVLTWMVWGWGWLGKDEEEWAVGGGQQDRVGGDASQVPRQALPATS